MRECPVFVFERVGIALRSGFNEFLIELLPRDLVLCQQLARATGSSEQTKKQFPM